MHVGGRGDCVSHDKRQRSMSATHVASAAKARVQESYQLESNKDSVSKCLVMTVQLVVSFLTWSRTIGDVASCNNL